MSRTKRKVAPLDECDKKPWRCTSDRKKSSKPGSVAKRLFKKKRKAKLRDAMRHYDPDSTVLPDRRREDFYNYQ